MSELIYIGCKRTVFALDVESGEEVWRTRLPRLWGSHITLMVDGDSLFVARGSYSYRLERWTGEIIWEKVIPESANYLPMLATAGGTSGAGQRAALIAAAEDAEAAGGA